MESMQGIIDEGSDHIKDLERKIKTQGMGQNYDGPYHRQYMMGRMG